MITCVLYTAVLDFDFTFRVLDSDSDVSSSFHACSSLCICCVMCVRCTPCSCSFLFMCYLYNLLPPHRITSLCLLLHSSIDNMAINTSRIGYDRPARVMGDMCTPRNCHKAVQEAYHGTARTPATQASPSTTARNSQTGLCTPPSR